MSIYVCVCLSVCPRAYIRNHARDLYKFFCTCCLWPWLSLSPAGWQNPNRKGQFLGVFFPMTIHCNACAAERTIRSTITSRYRRDHSVAAAFAANGIGREGGDGSAQRRRSVIYDCLVLRVSLLPILVNKDVCEYLSSYRWVWKIRDIRSNITVFETT